MTTQSKENIMKYWPLVVGVLMVSGTWFGMIFHMNDDSIHVGLGERVLTDIQFNTLIQHSANFATIKENKESIIELNTYKAVHKVEYKNLFLEHEGLETKSSRADTRLEDKINEIHE